MSLISDTDLLDYLGITDGGLEASNALLFRDATEAFIARYCRRTFESATHTLERYDGTGTKYLRLKSYPITALYRLSVGVDEAIRIKNTVNNSSASVSVNSTGIVLEVNGTANSTCLFASYSTITLIVAAINAIGSGWSAEVVDYATYSSSSLLPRFGANANDSNDVYLYIPYEAEDEFEVDENTGTIYLPGGFPSGNKNVFVTYTAGYTSSTVPSDLKIAILETVKYNYDKYKNNVQNVERYTIGDLEFWFSKDSQKFASIPLEAKQLLGYYKRVMV